MNRHLIEIPDLSALLRQSAPPQRGSEPVMQIALGADITIRYTTGRTAEEEAVYAGETPVYLKALLPDGERLMYVPWRTIARVIAHPPTDGTEEEP